MAETTTEGNTVDIERLKDFDTNCTDALQKNLEIQQIWRDALIHGVEVPWNAYEGTKWNNIAQYHTVDGNYQLDVEATRIAISKAMKWARLRGYDVKKKEMDENDTDWEMYVTTPLGKFTFHSTRQVTCVRVVTGTEIVPAQEEKVVEKVEWVCEKIAFLSIDTE